MPRINQLPAASSVAQTDVLAIDTTDKTYKVPRSVLAPAPYIVTIPTGQWSGSGSDRYITVTASNVTADALLYPFYDNASSALLNGPVWAIPAAGSFTIHTSAIPSGTVTISVLLAGIVGEAQYQVLSDVYSKSQVDSIVSQSTANTNLNGTVTGYLPVKNSGCAVFSGGNANDAYSIMSQLIPGRCVPFVIANADAASLLTDGKLTSLVKGILSRTGANGQFYDFVGGPGGGYNKMYSWRVTATSDADMSTQTVYEFTGTAI